MTAKEVLETVAEMPEEEWMKIQRGLADMICARFSSAESDDTRQALAEAEAEFDRGEGLDADGARRWFRA